MYGASRSSSKQQVIDPISRYIHTRRPDALQLRSRGYTCFLFFSRFVSFRCCGGFYDTPHQQFLLLLALYANGEKQSVGGNSQLYYYTILYSIYDSYIFIYFCVCVVWWWPPYVVWTASIFNSSTLSLRSKNIFLCIYISKTL